LVFAKIGKTEKIAKSAASPPLSLNMYKIPFPPYKQKSEEHGAGSMEHGAGSMEYGSWSLELEIGSVVATESQLLIMFNRKLIEKAECAKLVCKINESRGIALYA